MPEERGRSSPGLGVRAAREWVTMREVSYRDRAAEASALADGGMVVLMIDNQSHPAIYSLTVEEARRLGSLLLDSARDAAGEA